LTGVLIGVEASARRRLSHRCEADNDCKRSLGMDFLFSRFPLTRGPRPRVCRARRPAKPPRRQLTSYSAALAATAVGVTGRLSSGIIVRLPPASHPVRQFGHHPELVIIVKLLFEQDQRG